VLEECGLQRISGSGLQNNNTRTWIYTKTAKPIVQVELLVGASSTVIIISPPLGFPSTYCGYVMLLEPDEMNHARIVAKWIFRQRWQLPHVADNALATKSTEKYTVDAQYDALSAVVEHSIRDYVEAFSEPGAVWHDGTFVALQRSADEDLFEKAQLRRAPAGPEDTTATTATWLYSMEGESAIQIQLLIGRHSLVVVVTPPGGIAPRRSGIVFLLETDKNDRLRIASEWSFREELDLPDLQSDSLIEK
jgi:hypothetical protein